MKKVRLLGGPFDGDEIEVSEDMTEVSLPWLREEKKPIIAVYKAEIGDEFFCVELKDAFEEKEKDAS